jgi:dCMP deaminase
VPLGDELIRGYFGSAYRYASLHSDDPNTHVGAIILAADGRMSIGANAFPIGVKITQQRQQRPVKYDYLLHAEESAIIEAARDEVSTIGATMLAPWAACSRCGRQIIQAGITRLIRHTEMMQRTPEKWIADIKLADEMMIEAGVEIVEWSGVVGNCKHLLNDEVWRP